MPPTLLRTTMYQWTESFLTQVKLRLASSPFFFGIFGGILFLALLSAIFYMFKGGPQRLAVEYIEEVVGLVPDKISASAAIVVKLPEGILPQEAKAAITFTPEIKGSWAVEEPKEGFIAYYPKDPLEVGAYYALALDTQKGTVEDGFIADEDPAIAAIFPAEESEANEYSNITIVFNRPMVPLTTLSELKTTNIPVTITPQTKGRFKWITTRNLQFIPEKHLTRSSHYTVTVGTGFVSMDGLSVAPLSHTFTTRPLRYETIHRGDIVYNQPLRVVFNQPVDLERLRGEITLKDVTEGKAKAFTLRYGKREVPQDASGDTVMAWDQSIVEVYNQKDVHGREDFWDFEHRYTLDLARAHPLEGDIWLNLPLSSEIYALPVIREISATSERSQDVSQTFFDPQGELLVTFFEDIDLAKTNISAKFLTNTAYRQKCKEGVEYNREVECEKEDDLKTLVLTFDATKIPGETNIDLVFEKIVNQEGVVLNAQPITKTITSYLPLSVITTVPAQRAQGADPSFFELCTSTPMDAPAEEEWGKRLSANQGVVIFSWPGSRLISQPSPYNPCAPGQFYTRISYGLNPRTAYTLSLSLEDVFGQRINHRLTLATGDLPAQSRNFFHFQQNYAVTTPGKTKLTYATQNLPFVDVHICKVAPSTMFAYVENRITYTTPPAQLACQSQTTTRMNLPTLYWAKNYFTLNLSQYVPNPLGHYVISFSNPDYRQTWDEGTMIYERTLLTVTNLSVVEKEIRREGVIGHAPDDNLSPRTLNSLQNLYWVTEIGTLKPVKDALVVGYAQTGKDSFAPIVQAKTDARGIARTPTVWNLRGAVVSAGEESAIVTQNYEQNLQYALSARSAQRVYLYTDRPIYKPGDTVFIKGLYRVGYDGAYEVFQKNPVPLVVRNSKDEVVKNENLTVSDYGTFQTSLVLDANAALGSYRINALGGLVQFDVEEYVPAAFELKATTDKEEYVAGDTFNLSLDARYYFGVPLEGGEVTYSIVSQDYYFDRYQDEYFMFGIPWYWCYQGCSYGDKFILRGKTPLEVGGKARISHKLDFDQFFTDEEKKQSKIFVVYATVTNFNGQSITTQKSFIVHRGEFYLGVKAQPSFLAKNASTKIRAKSVDKQGSERSVRGLTLEVSKVTWKYIKRQEVDGGYYYRSQKERETVITKGIATDGRGNWEDTIALTKEGEYEVRVYGEDEKDNVVEGITGLYVYGEGFASIRPTNDPTLELVTETKNVEVGQSAQVIIKSPFARSKALIAIERGDIFHYEVIDINQNLYSYRFPIEERYVPNVFVSVLLLSPSPEVKFGQLEFSINRNRESFSIDVETDKQFYLPGERVNISLEARDYRGNPVSAEISLAVVDLSVLALKGNPKKNPLVFFYDGFPLTVTTSSNIKNVLIEVDVPSQTKGGGGLTPEDLARRKRGEFKDTAFWQAAIYTDKDGKARVSFTLPDNLTRWQIEGVGITKDTKLGVGYREFTARKELMVIPLHPRFIVPGDTFMIGAKVFNQTNDTQRLSVSFTSDTLAQQGNTKPQSLRLEAGATDTVYFDIEAPLPIDTGEHVFILSAKSSSHEDTVEERIPITENVTYEIVATAGIAKGDEVKEFIYLPQTVLPDRGGLTIETSATLAVFVSDALQYLFAYPYGCSEQIASKLSSIAVLKKALAVKNLGDAITLSPVEFDGTQYTMDEVVSLGLARIYENEAPGGGFAYYAGMQPNFYLTLHVVNTLADIKDAGYAIREEVLERGSRYLYSHVMTNPKLRADRDLLILTAYTISRLNGFESEKTNLFNLVLPLAQDDAFLSEEISSISLAHLILFFNNLSLSTPLKENALTTLTNRITIDGRGAYLKPNATNVVWSYYETPIKDTALLLKVLSEEKREHPLLDKILRWIFRARQKDGAWGSTNNTLAVVDAFTAFLNWQREAESSYTLNVLVNDTKRKTYDINSQTILTQFKEFVPINDLSRQTLVPVSLVRTKRNNLANNVYYDMSLQYFLPLDRVPPRDEGISVARSIYRLEDIGNQHAITEAEVGDVLRVRLTLTLPEARNFLMVEDYIPAGTEIINFSFATEDPTLLKNLFQEERGVGVRTSRSLKNFFGGLFFQGEGGEYVYEPDPRAQSRGGLSPDAKELHRDRMFLFKERLAPGVYEYEYFVRALIPGTYQHLPAQASEMYFPEHFGRTPGSFFTISN